MLGKQSGFALWCDSTYGHLEKAKVFTIAAELNFRLVNFACAFGAGLVTKGDRGGCEVAENVIVELGYNDSVSITRETALAGMRQREWFLALQRGASKVEQVIFITQPTYCQVAGARKKKKSKATTQWQHGEVIHGSTWMQEAATLVRDELSLTCRILDLPAEELYAGFKRDSSGVLWQDEATCRSYTENKVDYNQNGELALWFDAEHPSPSGAEAHLRRTIAAILKHLQTADQAMKTTAPPPKAMPKIRPIITPAVRPIVEPRGSIALNASLSKTDAQLPQSGRPAPQLHGTSGLQATLACEPAVSQPQPASRAIEVGVQQISMPAEAHGTARLQSTLQLCEARIPQNGSKVESCENGSSQQHSWQQILGSGAKAGLQTGRPRPPPTESPGTVGLQDSLTATASQASASGHSLASDESRFELLGRSFETQNTACSQPAFRVAEPRGSASIKPALSNGQAPSSAKQRGASGSLGDETRTALLGRSSELTLRIAEPRGSASMKAALSDGQSPNSAHRGSVSMQAALPGGQALHNGEPCRSISTKTALQDDQAPNIAERRGAEVFLSAKPAGEMSQAPSFPGRTHQPSEQPEGTGFCKIWLPAILQQRVDVESEWKGLDDQNKRYLSSRHAETRITLGAAPQYHAVITATARDPLRAAASDVQDLIESIVETVASQQRPSRDADQLQDAVRMERYFQACGLQTFLDADWLPAGEPEPFDDTWLDARVKRARGSVSTLDPGAMRHRMSANVD